MGNDNYFSKLQSFFKSEDTVVSLAVITGVLGILVEQYTQFSAITIIDFILIIAVCIQSLVIIIYEMRSRCVI